jgi:tetratricopeptide (TPR) repeat protein
MTRDNILFGIIGLLLGCIVGFVFANTVNQRGYAPVPPPTASGSSNLPADHPPLAGADGGAPQAGPNAAQPPEVTAKIQKAKDEPSNFDAQMEAAQLYYQIQRFPQALELLQKAVALRPKDFGALSALGNVNFDTGNYTEAERWYRAALQVKPDAVGVSTDLGSTFMQRTPPDPVRAIQQYQVSLKIDPTHELTLVNLVRAYAMQKNTAEAKSTLDRLAQVNPNNSEIPTLRTQLGAN